MKHLIAALSFMVALSAGQVNAQVGAAGIGPLYHFTAAPAVLEEAEVVRNLGAKVHKFALSPAAGQTLLQFYQTDPATQGIITLPFDTLVMWAMPHTGASGAGAVFLPAYTQQNYNELYALTLYLRQTYIGTGRRFYVGGWEADNALFGSCPAGAAPSSTNWTNAISYNSNRQQAVNDAKAATPHSDVEVYHYVEVNCVQTAMKGYSRVINAVVPQINPAPDAISYSSYDSLYPDANTLLPPALAYLKSFGIPVFIGEFGFKASYWGAAGQATQSQKVINAAIAAKLPLALYWAVYDDTGNGYQIIDKAGVIQPVAKVLFPATP